MWTSLQRDGFLAVDHLARATPALHLAFRLFAEYGVVLFGALLLAAWWRARSLRSPRAVAAALWAPLGMLLAVALNQPVGSAVREPRPYTTFPHALVLVARSHDFSFPSDHAVMAGAVATGVALALGRSALSLLAALAAVLMAFTRVYVGAHYPLDVAAGLTLGAAVTLIGWWVVSRPMVRLVERLDRSPLRPLLTTAPGRAAAPAR